MLSVQGIHTVVNSVGRARKREQEMRTFIINEIFHSGNGCGSDVDFNTLACITVVRPHVGRRTATLRVIRRYVFRTTRVLTISTSNGDG